MTGNYRHVEGLLVANALIVGLGREGLALARYLTEHGTTATVAEGRPETELRADAATLAALGVPLIAGNDHPNLDAFDIVYLNPAVSKEAPVARDARARGLPVSALTDLFFEICPAPIAGITGSSGKTTTTTVLGQMARAGGFTTHVGGNIGRPLLNEAASMSPDDWVVLEMSSFQLEWLRQSPHIAVVTNLTANHLDRHHTMDEYAAAKLPIVAYQRPDDIAVLNADDSFASYFARATRGSVLYFSLVSAPTDGAGLEGEMLAIRHGGKSGPVCALSDLRVPGNHNVANVLAAIAAADAMGVAPAAMRDAIRSFSGVAHRLQLVRTLDGVRYYNDSIATSPERALAALAAVRGPLVLILGGHDKQLPWDALCQAAVERCRAVLLIGEAAPVIAAHLGDALRARPEGILRPERIVYPGDIDGAVAQAHALARAGDAVLLSPACASYDQFRNFEERGTRFCELVEALHGSY